MSSIKSKVHDGRIEFTAPSDWPEGFEVITRPAIDAEENDRMSPEEIQSTLKAMDEFFAMEFDPEAAKEMKEIIDEIRKRDKETAFSRLEKISKGWD